MIKKLKDICSIKLGVTFRSKLDFAENGNCHVVQMKDLSDDNIVDVTGILRIDHPNIKNAQLLQKDDLVFRSRGQTINSAIVTRDISDVIFASPLLRIRITSNDILPAYLNWYLNQEDAQSYLRKKSDGSAALRMVTKKNLEQIPIQYPSLEVQQKIIEISELADREMQILDRIKNLKSKYYSSVLLNTLQISR